MKGMRTKGTDLNTDFGELKASNEELPLARVQGDMFESTATDKTSAYSVEELADTIMRGEEFVQTGFGKKRKQGLTEMLTSDAYSVSEIVEALLNGNPQLSTDWGNKNPAGVEDMVQQARSGKSASKKKAVIFDGYAYRVTVESKARDNNQTYSAITNILSNLDVRYREVRRYTIEPDRVMMDILIKKEDADTIKEADKTSKEYDITFTFNDSISEGVQPKTIVTPEKEVPEKVEASKKTAANWKYQIDLKSLRDQYEAGSLPIEDFGSSVAEKIEDLYSKLSEEDAEEYGGELMDIQYKFEVVETEEEFDNALNHLFEWADTEVAERDGTMANRLAWVNFFCTEF